MKEALVRCFAFISAVYAESEKLQEVKDDQRAYAMGQMKINLTGYIMNIWESRAALDADIKTIGAVLEDE